MERLRNCSMFFTLQKTRLQSPGATDDKYVKIVSVNVVNVCTALEVQIYSFLTSAPDRGELLLLGSGHFNPQDNSPQCA
jgi:hypothetical protein